MPEKTRWIRAGTNGSTYPPLEVFTQDAETIARTMASKKVSPKGIASGIHLIQFFINRAGQGLSTEQRRELERAKCLLQAKRRIQAAPR